MLGLQEEDEIARKLSELTPMEYSQLMAKVKRRQWELTGPYLFYTPARSTHYQQANIKVKTKKK